MIVSDNEVCHEKTTKGKECRARIITNSEYCFFHDPQKSIERRAASQRGGRNKRLAVLDRQTPDLPLKTVDQIIGLLEITVNEVRRGELSPKIANTIGYLAAILLKAKRPSY